MSVAKAVKFYLEQLSPLRVLKGQNVFSSAKLNVCVLLWRLFVHLSVRVKYQVSRRFFRGVFYDALSNGLIACFGTKINERSLGRVLRTHPCTNRCTYPAICQERLRTTARNIGHGRQCPDRCSNSVSLPLWPEHPYKTTCNTACLFVLTFPFYCIW
jgi:hypothetical protein